MPLFAPRPRSRRGRGARAARRARRAGDGAAGERGARPRRRVGALGRRRPVRRAAGRGGAGAARRSPRRAGLHGRARRRPRLGGAGPRGADPGRGRAVRGLRQPRPRPGAAEPHRARDRGGAGVRHRPSCDDAGLPARARPAGEGGLPAAAGRRRRRRHRRAGDGGGAVWPLRAVAGDIDPVATATARANAAANGVGARLACVTAPGLRHPRLRAGAPYDLVFANILAGPLRRMARELAGAQAPGGVAILSGILARQAAAVLATYRGWGYRPADVGGDRRVADAGAAPRRLSGQRPRAKPRRRRRAVRPMSASWSSLRRRSSATVARRASRVRRLRTSALGAGDDGEDADGAERDGTGAGDLVDGHGSYSFVMPPAGRAGSGVARVCAAFMGISQSQIPALPPCVWRMTLQSLGECSGFVLVRAARQRAEGPANAGHRHRPGAAAHRLGRRRRRGHAAPPRRERGRASRRATTSRRGSARCTSR